MGCKLDESVGFRVFAEFDTHYKTKRVPGESNAFDINSSERSYR